MLSLGRCDLVKHVRFNIFRKAAFAGALLPYNIYINGEFVGTIKNGKTLNVDVPEADIYYLEDNNSFERNAVIINSNTIDYNILIKRAGGWRTDHIMNSILIMMIHLTNFLLFISIVL